MIWVEASWPVRWRLPLSAAAGTLLAVGTLSWLATDDAQAWPARTAATCDVLFDEQTRYHDDLLRAMEYDLRALRVELRHLGAEDREERDLDDRIEGLLARIRSTRDTIPAVDER